MAVKKNANKNNWKPFDTLTIASFVKNGQNQNTYLRLFVKIFLNFFCTFLFNFFLVLLANSNSNENSKFD